MNALESLRHAHGNRADLARAFKASGGKVVGYVCDNVPAELFRAAGMMPFRLSGDPARNRHSINSLLGEVHTTRLVGLEFMDAITAKLVAGELDFVDYLVVPHNRKPVQAIGALLESVRKTKPGTRVPQFYYLDRTYVRDFLTSGYNRKQLMRLVEAVEAWAGSRIGTDALHASLAEAAESRRLLRELNALRLGGTPRVSGVEALEIFAASHFMEPAALQSALRSFLAEARARAPLSGTRLYVGGSPLDHTAFYAAVEQAGAIVVAEDHCWGARCAELDVAFASDPFDALAARFVAQPACSLRASIDDTTTAVVRRALGANAQGAIFNVIRGDTSQMWETPSQLDQLRERGLPCLHLKAQPYQIEDPAALTARVAEFIEEINTADRESN